MNELKILSAISHLTERIDRLGRTRPTKPVIYNIAITDTNTEYQWMLPRHTKSFKIQCRDGTAFRFSFEHGVVAAANPGHMTVLANGSYQARNIDADGLILYVACASGSKVVECIAWS